MAPVIRAGEDVYLTRVRQASPQAVWIARALGRLFGNGINGHAGTVRYGAPAIGTRSHFTGYANPPQLFRGYDPRKVAAGSFRGSPNHLPATTSPSMSPLAQSMATVTNATQMGG